MFDTYLGTMGGTYRLLDGAALTSLAGSYSNDLSRRKDDRRA